MGTNFSYSLCFLAQDQAYNVSLSTVLSIHLVAISVREAEILHQALRTQNKYLPPQICVGADISSLVDANALYAFVDKVSSFRGRKLPGFARPEMIVIKSRYGR